MQVNNNGPVYGQTNIDNSITLARTDLQTGLAQLKQLIASGAIPADVGMDVVTEVNASLNQTDGQPSGRLKAAAQRLRDMLSIGGASAEDIGKISTAIAAISTVIGG